jgi:hypothetical protein
VWRTWTLLALFFRGVEGEQKTAEEGTLDSVNTARSAEKKKQKWSEVRTMKTLFENFEHKLFGVKSEWDKKKELKWELFIFDLNTKNKKSVSDVGARGKIQRFRIWTSAYTRRKLLAKIIQNFKNIFLE